MGLIQFSIGMQGEVKSIIISQGIPEEISNRLRDIVILSKWSPMKKNGKTVESLPMLLPVYISIEIGCETGNIKRGFGVGGDFTKMFSKAEKNLFLNCIFLEPFTYIRPAP